MIDVSPIGWSACGTTETIYEYTRRVDLAEAHVARVHRSRPAAGWNASAHVYGPYTDPGDPFGFHATHRTTKHATLPEACVAAEGHARAMSEWFRRVAGGDSHGS